MFLGSTILSSKTFGYPPVCILWVDGNLRQMAFVVEPEL
jgi:hypothetical protein